MTPGDVWRNWVEVRAAAAGQDWLANWRELQDVQIGAQLKLNLEREQEHLIQTLIKHGDQTVVAMICYFLCGNQDGDDCMAEFCAHMQRAMMAKLDES